VPVEQEDILHGVVTEHPRLTNAGEGEATPSWVIGAQKKWARFVQVSP
jgi:hypothetical protein